MCEPSRMVVLCFSQVRLTLCVKSILTRNEICDCKTDDTTNRLSFRRRDPSQVGPMYSGIPQLYRLGFGVVVWHEDTPISLTNHRVIKETKENEKAGKDMYVIGRQFFSNFSRFCKFDPYFRKPITPTICTPPQFLANHNSHLDSCLFV